MKKIFLLLITVVTFSESCKTDSPSSPTPSTSETEMDSLTQTSPLQKDQTTSQNLQLLIFKKEKKIEIWTNQKKLDEINCEDIAIEGLPFGTFNVSEKNNEELILEFPNEFYQHKKQSLASLQNNDTRLRLNEVCYKNRIKSIINATHVWVFPNDARDSTQFNPCFACPHWTAELYSQLYLQLNQFSVPIQ